MAAGCQRSQIRHLRRRRLGGTQGRRPADGGPEAICLASACYFCAAGGWHEPPLALRVSIAGSAGQGSLLAAELGGLGARPRTAARRRAQRPRQRASLRKAPDCAIHCFLVLVVCSAVATQPLGQRCGPEIVRVQATARFTCVAAQYGTVYTPGYFSSAAPRPLAPSCAKSSWADTRLYRSKLVEPAPFIPVRRPDRSYIPNVYAL